MEKIAQVKVKIEKYEEFLDGRLKPDLIQAVAARDKVFEKQRVYSDLAKNIQMLQQSGTKKLRTMVNLGSEVYAQAEVPDTSRIFVDVGLGFHVEFTLKEALEHIESKQIVLKSEIDQQSKQIASVKAHIKLVTEGIRELMNLPAE